MRKLLSLFIAAAVGLGVGWLGSRYVPKRGNVDTPKHEEELSAKKRPLAENHEGNGVSSSKRAQDAAATGAQKQKGEKVDTSPHVHYFADETPGKPLYVKGWAVRGRYYNVALSDGRTLTERDNLRMIDRNGVVLADGTFYAFRSVDVPRAAPAGADAAIAKPVGEPSAVDLESRSAELKSRPGVMAKKTGAEAPVAR